MARKAIIIGTGSYLPDRIITNDDLAQTLDTSDEWIKSRSGIKTRHRAAPDELTSDLAVLAAKAAMQSASVTPDDIDLIVIATTTPDLTFPATAAIVQKKLGISHGAAFDMQAVCSGFVYGISIVAAMLESGQAKRALLIGAETMSRIIDWTDRSTAVLFGDGAGAVVIEARKTDNDAATGIIGSYLRSDGAYSDLLYVDGGPSSTGTTGHLQMNGPEVYRHAVGNIAEAINTLLAQSALTIDEVDWFVPHQANKRIIDGVAKKIGLPAEKTVLTIEKHANTSAASIPLALDALSKSGRLRSGDLVMLEAMGGGLSWGANLIRWA